MERDSSSSRSSSKSLSSILADDEKPLLPFPVHQKPKFRVRALLGHCLYRRVILWSIAVFFLLCLTLSSGGARQRRNSLLEMVNLGQAAKDRHDVPQVVFVVPATNDAADVSQGKTKPSWLRLRQ